MDHVQIRENDGQSIDYIYLFFHVCPSLFHTYHFQNLTKTIFFFQIQILRQLYVCDKDDIMYFTSDSIGK